MGWRSASRGAKGGGAQFALTRNRAFDVAGVRRGTNRARARRRIDGERVHEGGPGSLLIDRRPRWTLVLHVRRDEVSSLAVAPRRMAVPRVRNYLQLVRG